MKPHHSKYHPEDRAIAERMRKARIATRTTATRMAEWLGIGSEQIRRYEIGRGRWPASYIVIACRHMGVSAAHILTGE